MYQEWEKWAQQVKVYPLDTRDYGERSRAYKRQINGEFDLGFGDWNIHNPGEIASFAIDRSGRISGTNAAQITMLKQGGKPADAALVWVFPTGAFKQFEVSLKARASQEATLVVRLEQTGNPKNKVIDETVTLDKETKQFTFKSKPVGAQGQYRLSFYTGTNKAGEKIWLDAITLDCKK